MVSSRFKTTLLLAFVILRFQVFMTTSIKMVGCLLECCSETDRRFRGADNLLYQDDEYSSETSVNLYSTEQRYISENSHLHLTTFPSVLLTLPISSFLISVTMFGEE